MIIESLDFHDIFMVTYIICGTIVSQTKFFKKWYMEFVHSSICLVPQNVESKECDEWRFRASFSLLFLVLCFLQMFLIYIYECIRKKTIIECPNKMLKR